MTLERLSKLKSAFKFSIHPYTMQLINCKLSSIEILLYQILQETHEKYGEKITELDLSQKDIR